MVASGAGFRHSYGVRLRPVVVCLLDERQQTQQWHHCTAACTQEVVCALLPPQPLVMRLYACRTT